jgi:putative MATE family efflux protein
VEDLTEGSIARHLTKLAAPIAIGMVFQTLYYLVDLYFVAQLGEAAIAGLTSAGNVQFLVMALTQVLGVGTMALIAHASGRKDQEDANLIFNQSLLLAALCAAVTLTAGYALAGWYMNTLTADPATATAGRVYLHWFLPGLGLQFALIAMGSALRGTGVAKPTIIVQMATVTLNAVLAPIMIAGWLTNRPLGVLGAGLSSSIAVAVGVLLMLLYFARFGRYVTFNAQLLRPRMEAWKRMLRVGLPPGGEFALMFVYMGVVYWSIREFGAQAQAAYGVGSRVMQAIFLPAMAIAFAAAPLAGQNMGAGKHGRVRQTLRTAVLAGSAMMLVLTLLCQVRPELLIGGFTDDTLVINLGADFLRIISWNFVAVGIIFTCSSMFQALGNTIPALLSSASRLLTFALPTIWLSSRPGFELAHVWYLSVGATTLQAITSGWLLRQELRRRLGQD